MSTTSTTYDWYWYIRKKGRQMWLGLVDENGDAPSSVLEIEIIAEVLPNWVYDDDDFLPIQAQYEGALAKAVAAEIMLMSSSAPLDVVPLYKKEFKEMKDKVLMQGVRESQQPVILKPLDFRDD